MTGLRYVPAALLITAALLAATCRRAGPLRNLPDEMAASIPSDTIALAGLHLDQIRDTDFYQGLPAGWLTTLEPLQQATNLLLASNGKDLLAIARGRFSAPPAGGTLLTPNLALAGSAAAVRAATAQHARGLHEATSLLAEAGAITEKPVWLIAEGGHSLPLTGNFANLNTLLGLTKFATLTADFESGVHIEVAALCPTSDTARQLEEKLRAIMTLAQATSHDRDIIATLQSVDLQREDSTVHLHLATTAVALEKLVR